jgi:phenylpyruvate tautomerase PptA (4-oxalocrotonate tautomerase family)
MLENRPMPVLRISGLPQREGVDVEGALRAVATAVAALLDEPPHGTWATWEAIPPGSYVEGGDGASVQPPSTHPPLVRLLSFEGRVEEQIEAMLACVADVLARELQLEPGNVFVVYEEVLAGRLSSGGRVVRRSGTAR